MDRPWFEHMIETAPWRPKAGWGKTPRQFAIVLFNARSKKEELTAAGHLSKRLSGHIEFSPDDIVKVAELFDVSVVEVLKHLGYRLDDKGHVK